MFGGSPLVCTNSDTGEWVEHKTEDMPLGKINIREESLRANEE